MNIWIELAKFCLRRAGINSYDIDRAMLDISWTPRYGNIKDTKLPKELEKTINKISEEERCQKSKEHPKN